MNKILNINPSIFKLIGMLVGVILIIVGIVTIAGGLGGNGYYADTAPYSYDTGYATFGADFYSYVCNNSAEAAEGALTAARNTRAIGELLRNVCGVAFIAFGLVDICAFGLIPVAGKKEETTNVTAADNTATDSTAATEEATETVAPADETPAVPYNATPAQQENPAE